MSDKAPKQVVVHSLESTPLDFPEPSIFVEPEYAQKTREVIQANSVRDNDGKTALNAKALPHALCTDIVGAKKFFNRLPNKDKFKVGNDRFVRTPALKRELDERIEKPYDAKKIEQMKENERCLTALRCRVPDDQIVYRSYPLLAARELLQQFIREQVHEHQTA